MTNPFQQEVLWRCPRCEHPGYTVRGMVEQDRDAAGDWVEEEFVGEVIYTCRNPECAFQSDDEDAFRV